MDALEKQYRQQQKAYDDLVATTIRNPDSLSTTLPQIQGIQSQLSSILDKMITEVALMKEDNRLVERRDALIKQLQRVQKDYSALRQSTDKLETLRRIRAFEDESWRGTFRIYVILFAVVVVIVGLMIIFKRYAPAMSAMTPSNPTAITPLT
jgi:predicted RNase H-like nuclease (RuvC/YqgF family)